MTDRLCLAMGEYDHTRGIAEILEAARSLRVSVEYLEPEALFDRQWREGRTDVCELSFALYCNLIGTGDRRFIALPIFPSRRFRHGCVYVRGDAADVSLGDLAGRRIGIPEWCQTAGIWTRGLLSEEYGLHIANVRWYQGGVDSVGRVEHATLQLPPNVEVIRVQGRTLASMLHAGEIDAIMSAGAPRCVSLGDCCRPLSASTRRAELEYWERTRIFPIMHVMTVRSKLAEEDPGLLQIKYRAFEHSKEQSLRRIAKTQTSGS